MKWRMLALLLMLTTLLTPAHATGIQPKMLMDIDRHWAEEEMTALHDMGVFQGYQGESRSEEPITRAEFAALLTRAVYRMEGYTGSTYFPDIVPGDIFYDNISKAKEMGIIVGNPDGTFSRDAHVTREEIVLMLARLLQKEERAGVRFSDIGKAYPYRAELETVVGLGIVNGYSDNTFRPYENATRAEAAAMLVRMLEVHESASSQAEVSDLAASYAAYGADDRALALAQGSEREDLLFRRQVQEIIRAHGGTVSQTMGTPSVTAVSVTGSLARAAVSYRTDYTVTNAGGEVRQKSHPTSRDIYLSYREGKWTVYRTDTHFGSETPINLTWEVFQNPPDYAPDGVTALSPAWFEMDTGSVYPVATTIYDRDGYKIRLSDNARQSYLDYARQNGYELWPMYRSDFTLETAQRFFADDAAQRAALEILVDRALAYRLDGINFDFEYMYVANRDDYTAHVREVSLAMRELGMMTSVDVNKYDKTGGNWSLCFNRDALSRYTDYVVLMAYDQNGTWSTAPGPVAGLSWVEASIKSLLEEVPAERVILGVPFYNRSWEVKNGRVVKTSAISMAHANELAAQNNAVFTYSAADGQDVAKWSTGGSEFSIWMENAASIRRKAALVNRYGLAGVGSWRRGFETADVWAALQEELGV